MQRLLRSLCFFSLCLAAGTLLAKDEPAAPAKEAESQDAGSKKSSQGMPEGFGTLFNGTDLSGWIGMPHFDPRKLRAMSEEERVNYLDKNWEEVLQHWSVENGELVNDGKGPYLTTAKDYGDFELRLEYKTVASADSGIYLRGAPQVQIWDWTDEAKFKLGANKGSGGLYNNQKEGKDPLVLADNPFGEWNSFVIRMVGDTVSVWLNDKLVVNQVDLENYWDRTQPIFPVGPIQLQTHGGEIRFRNLWLKEIPRLPPEAGYLTVEGQPVGEGWNPLEVSPEGDAGNAGSVGDFDMHLVGKPSGDKPGIVRFRSANEQEGIEVALLPGGAATVAELRKKEPVVRGELAAAADSDAGGKDQHLYIRAVGEHVQVWLNEEQVADFLAPLASQEGGLHLEGLAVESAFLRPLQPAKPLESDAEQEAGFESIFDGTLTGWTGDTDGYRAEPNVLWSTKKGGNLFYEPELGDFVLRFDFQLDPGGNNGVGIRAPTNAKGSSAYQGTESQILDNTAPVYSRLQPYQYHGSVYGVIPAKRGYLKPVGHWNAEEIRVEGKNVRITLNGVVIVEGNLEEASKDGTPDHKEHPGLERTSGNIGFLGHGHEIGFRDIRVKRLESGDKGE